MPNAEDQLREMDIEELLAIDWIREEAFMTVEQEDARRKRLWEGIMQRIEANRPEETRADTNNERLGGAIKWALAAIALAASVSTLVYFDAFKRPERPDIIAEGQPSTNPTSAGTVGSIAATAESPHKRTWRDSKLTKHFLSIQCAGRDLDVINDEQMHRAMARVLLRDLSLHEKSNPGIRSVECMPTGHGGEPPRLALTFTTHLRKPRIYASVPARNAKVVFGTVLVPSLKEGGYEAHGLSESAIEFEKDWQDVRDPSFQVMQKQLRGSIVPDDIDGDGVSDPILASFRGEGPSDSGGGGRRGWRRVDLVTFLSTGRSALIWPEGGATTYIKPQFCFVSTRRRVPSVVVISKVARELGSSKYKESYSVSARVLTANGFERERLYAHAEKVRVQRPRCISSNSVVVEGFYVGPRKKRIELCGKGKNGTAAYCMIRLSDFSTSPPDDDTAYIQVQ